MPSPENSPNPSDMVHDTLEKQSGSILAPGELVGKLRILSHIASGGMAEIYKAQHEELEVVRAMKILKPGFTQEDKARFQTEAKISAHLHHPNIVQIYTVDVWKETLPYIEMEYVEGPSLADLIKEHRRLPSDFSIAVCSIVCNALEYAQLQNFTVYGRVYTGLVHRDIKPANILLAKRGTVKLADFGIAIPEGVSIHTVGPNTMGTYAYLSPEQLDGETLDQRSDIYSLGTVLYEMITGFKAFGDQTLPELVRAKLGGTYRPIQSFVPELPKSLVRLVDKSLSLDRKKRHDEVGDFGAALRRVLGDMNSLAPAEVVSKYLRQPTKDSLGLSGRRFFGADWLIPLLAGGAVLAFIIAAVITKTSLRIEPNPTPPPSPPPAQALHEAQSEALPGTGEALTEETPKQDIALSARTQPKPAAERVTRAPTGTVAEETAGKTQERKSPESVILALEAFLEEGNLTRALEYAERSDISDGYFHLLRGKALYRAGRYDRAEAALNQAQTTRTAYGSGVKREATYLWALNRSAIYKKKPNLNNKTIALKAWHNFQRVFCRTDAAGGQCAEAERMVEELGE